MHRIFRIFDVEFSADLEVRMSTGSRCHHFRITSVSQGETFSRGCNWLLSEIDGDQECRMPFSDSGEAEESVVRRQHVQVSVGEGVFRPQLDERLEGQKMRGLSTASTLELDVDRVHVGVDG